MINKIKCLIKKNERIYSLLRKVRRSAIKEVNNTEKIEPIKAKPIKAKPIKAKPIKAKPIKAKPIKAKPIKAKPIAVFAYPCAGTFRLTPPLESLLAQLGWSVVGYSPFMVNSKYHDEFLKNNKAKALDSVDADNAIYWRIRSLDYSQGLILHEWASLKKIAEIDCSIVVLMRDPRDLVNSFYWHDRNSINGDILKVINGYTRFFPSPSPYTFRWPDINEIMDEYLFAMNHPNIHVIRFEDMHRNDEEAIKDLLIRLKVYPNACVEITDKMWKDAIHLGSFEFQTQGRRKRGDDVVGYLPNGGSARKGIVGDWKSSFTPEIIDYFKEKTGDKLIKLGYEKDSNW